MAVYQPVWDGPVDVDAVAVELGFTGGRTVSTDLVVPDGDGACLRHVRVRVVPLVEALPVLLDIPTAGGPSYRRPPDSLRGLAIAARLGLHLVRTHRIVPGLVAGTDGGAHAVWRALGRGDPDVEGVIARLAASLPRSAHAVVRDDGRMWAPDTLLEAFLDAVVDLCVRQAAPPGRPGRPRARLLPWTARWAEALADPEDSSVPLRGEAAELVAGVTGWLDALGRDSETATTELRLSAPGSEKEPWRLDFGIRTDAGAWMPATRVWSAPESAPDGTGAAAEQALLEGLGRGARVFAPLEDTLREAAPAGVSLSVNDAWTFISEAAPLLETVGVIVRLPDDIVSRELRLRLRVGVDGDEVEAPVTTDATSGAALDTAETGYRWEAALGDETLSDAELDALLDAGAPLVHWRGHWVRVDPAATRPLRTLAGPGSLSIGEALGLALAGSTAAGPGRAEEAGEVEVVADGRVARLVKRILGAVEHPPPPRTPEGFVGELREYQRRGVAWLEGMAELGLGGVLADDMGLGKTIQLIGFLLGRVGPGPHLIVCPTSVVGNWQREIARFAPSLQVHRHHGGERPDDLAGVSGVVLTSYGTLRRDVSVLAKVDWDVVTLDEAQQVKNPATAGAKAVRQLRARHKFALTGTPLENRLSELWSLMDATNPGMLGSRARFAKRFVTPVEKRRDRDAAERLRRLVAPFVLRREKTDPRVIADLPDKIERTVVCPLTPEQAKLYQAAVDRVLGSDGAGLAGAGDMERRGRILALLTELKQICNHPEQRAEEPDAGSLTRRSGKLEVAREIVLGAVDAGEQVLVFSQYVVMARLLAQQVSRDLGTDIPLLHGGMAAGARDRVVASFQGERGAAPPVLVVSLRAGGTGLNLTAATHVLHYDRWWNPAVEDQATGRAHRIGQRRTVEVHKLVTSGTLEERIADVLESKRALAETVVGAGESWVTELSDADLADLVSLGEGAGVVDLDDEDEPWLSGWEEAS